MREASEFATAGAASNFNGRVNGERRFRLFTFLYVESEVHGSRFDRDELICAYEDQIKRGNVANSNARKFDAIFRRRINDLHGDANHVRRVISRGCVRAFRVASSARFNRFVNARA